MSHDVFLSYRRADTEVAKALVENLESRGAKVWWDQKIGKGQDWRDSIAENLEDSSAVVILFSEKCNSSKQLKKELAVADHIGKMVIPVLIEKTEPKGHFLYELAARNWIELFPDALSKVDKLSDDLLEVEEVRSSWAGEEPEAEEQKKPKEEEKHAKRTPAPLEAEGKKRKRDFLPFAWYDVVPVGLLTVLLAWSSAFDGRSAPLESSEWVGIAALTAAVYGVVAFPIRYYKRRRSPYRTFWMLVLSYVVLLAVFQGAMLVYMSDELADDLLIGTAVFVGLGVVAFVVYWVLSWQRARKIRLANTRTI